MNEIEWRQDDYYEGHPETVSFDELSTQIQNDLTKWFNEHKPGDEDKELLLELYTDGRFYAWDCPECGDRVFYGCPDSWDCFQGSRNQDFSYFGNPDKYQQDYIDACCDSCRCYKLV